LILISRIPNFKQMKTSRHRKAGQGFQIALVLLGGLLLISPSCEKDPDPIVPDEGFKWPDNNRSYWPGEAWETAPMEEHFIDVSKMNLADDFAENDPLARALLVIKDGYLVFENYYGEGGIDQSTDLWSVTKSYSSAVLGIMMDQGEITSTSEFMADLLPAYPEFDKITLHNITCLL